MRLLLAAGIFFAFVACVGIGLFLLLHRARSQPAAPKNPNALQFKILLEHSTRRSLGIGAPSERHSVSVTPLDAKGRKRETPSTSLWIDNIPLRYVVGVGNYYDRHPHFKLPDTAAFMLQGRHTYLFTAATAPSQERAPFAEIQTPAPFSIDQLEVPKKIARHRDLQIRHTQIPPGVELTYFRSFHFKDENGNEGFESGSPNSPDAVRTSLSGASPLNVPARYLQNPGGKKVSSIGLIFTAKTSGKFLNPATYSGEIEAVRTIEMEVDVVDAE